MGGPTLRTSKPDTATSSLLPTADADPQPSRTYPAPLLPTHPTGVANLNHQRDGNLQSELSSRDGTHPLSRPSPPSSLDLDQRALSRGLVNDDEDKERASLSQDEESEESQVESLRISETQVKSDAVDEEPEFQTDRGSLPALEPQPEQPSQGRLSLFSGMELVSRGRSMCHTTLTERESLQTEMGVVQEGDEKERLAADKSDISMDPTPLAVSDACDVTSPVCDVTLNSSQPASAFSFLNFWPFITYWNYVIIHRVFLVRICILVWVINQPLYLQICERKAI